MVILEIGRNDLTKSYVNLDEVRAIVVDVEDCVTVTWKDNQRTKFAIEDQDEFNELLKRLASLDMSDAASAAQGIISKIKEIEAL